jgi:hypothetical protein
MSHTNPPQSQLGIEQKRTDDQLPTPEYDVPGITDLSGLSEGDKIELDCKEEPLTVTKVGVREISLIRDDSTRQYAIAAEHDRENAIKHEFYEEINAADGEVIEIVDERGVPVRVFEVDQ